METRRESRGGRTWGGKSAPHQATPPDAGALPDTRAQRRDGGPVQALREWFQGLQGRPFLTPGVEDAARQASPWGALTAAALPTCWLYGSSRYVSFPREETNAKATSLAREEQQSRSQN